MSTYLDARIDALRGFGSRSASARTRLVGEKWQKQHDAEAARKQVETKLKASAEQRAAEMMRAVQQSQAAAKQREAQQKANLAASQARTKAATDYAQKRLDPWYQAGTDALGKLQEKIDSGPGEFEESPGYQFRLEEGQKAIERSAAARGGVLSGAAIKAGMRYNQDFATNDYDNFLRRYYESMQPLERMSGQGMTAGTQQGNFGMEGANAMAQQGLAGTTAIGKAQQYGADAYAQGIQQSANILAEQQKAAAERDYGYAAWKAGDEF